MKSKMIKKRYIKQAKAIAMDNGLDFHVAALLFRGKRLIKIGVNQTKTHPRFKRYKDNGYCGYCLHAEMDALRVAKPGDSMMVLRFTKRGNISMAKPCIHCQQFIDDAKIKFVYYSNWNGEIVKLR